MKRLLGWVAILLTAGVACAQTWPDYHLTNGTHYTSYGVEDYSSLYSKNLYIDPVAILQAGGTELDDIYDGNQVYLSGGTVYASAIDAADFTWNSGYLHLNGGTHTTMYGLDSGASKDLWVQSGATLNQVNLQSLSSNNRLLLEGGRLKIDSDFDASSEVYIAGGDCVIEVGGTLTGISSLSQLKNDLISDPSVTLILNGPEAMWNTGSSVASVSRYYHDPASIKVTNGGAMVGAGSALNSYNVNAVEISGIGSQWITSWLGIGEYGKSLVIADGGLVFSSAVTMGARFAGGNKVTVSGSGSQLNTGGFVVGYEGGGLNRVLVENGGSISSTGVSIGNYKNSAQNSVEVSGVGSQLNISGDIAVGVGGSGNSLFISDGGKVSNSVSRIGVDSEGSVANWSSVIVTGADSLWHNDGSLRVGAMYASDCSLVISEGGKVNNTDGFIASLAGGNCFVQVSGSGSKWNTSGKITIGNDNAYYTGNNMTISNGGEVVAGTGVTIIGSGNSLNLEQGGRLSINADFDGSMVGFNFNKGSTLAVRSQLTGLPVLEADRRLEASTVLGDMTVHGTFAPEVGTNECILNGMLIMETNGFIEMEIGGEHPALEHDRLTVTGSASLDGVLDVVFVDWYAPTNAVSFHLFNWDGGTTGGFAFVNLPLLASQWEWDTSELYTAGVLSVIPVIRISEIQTPSINLRSKGRTPITVLSTDDFDATSIDPPMVRFAKAAPVHYSFKDVDGDGDIDLKLQFMTRDLEIDPADTEAMLFGQTRDGELLVGICPVRIVPSK